jgi:hypothetical protein
VRSQAGANERFSPIDSARAFIVSKTFTPAGIWRRGTMP